jgi:hypothetical protein
MERQGPGCALALNYRRTLDCQRAAIHRGGTEKAEKPAEKPDFETLSSASVSLSLSASAVKFSMMPLAGWQNFYVIVGSSAGALIGLQFVVMSVISSLPTARPDADAGHAFATPNIVHFGAVLALAAVLCAPWETIGAIAVLCGLMGLGGIVYAAIVTHRMRTQDAYRPEFEDWLFHSLLPFAAYTTLAVSAYAAQFFPRKALFGVGAAALLLLFIGIHNAWDAVTFHVFARNKNR